MSHARRSMAVAAFGVFVAADDLLVVSTMLRPIINDLGLVLPDDLDATAWIVNVYLIAYLAVMPIAGRLSDVFGRRRVFMASLVVFAIGSIVVPQADSLAMLLVGRALTAIGGGALVPVALGVAGDEFEGGERAKAFGALGAIETIGWIWGPIYGALLVRYLGWEWQFHLNIPLALLGIGLGWFLLPVDRRREERIDWLGAALLTLGLTFVSLALLGQARIQSVSGLDQLQGEQKGVPLWLALLGAVLGFGGVAWRQARSPEPLLDLAFARAVHRRDPVLCLLVNGLFGAALITALVNVPLFVNVTSTGVERGAVESGWLLTALTGAMALTSLLGGRLVARLGLRAPTVLGFTLASVGFLVMGATWTVDSPMPEMVVPLAVIGAGLGFAMTPTTIGVVDASSEAATGTAAGLVIVARMVGFSVGLAALTTFGVRRYADLRATVELPALTDPGYQAAALEAAGRLTTDALAETFLGAGLVAFVALMLSALLSAQRR